MIDKTISDFIFNIETPERNSNEAIIEYQRATIEKLIKANRELREQIQELEARLGNNG